MSNFYVMMSRLVNGILEKSGYRITRIHALDMSLDAAFSRMLSRPVPVQTVIDIGASDGRWTASVQPYYPKASYYLIEANTAHATQLERLKREHTNVDYIMAAAGDLEGEIYFDARDSLLGIASHVPCEGYTRVPVTTVDAQVKMKQLKPPFLLKLDTHGFEVPILNGAPQTLQQTNLIVVETYNFQITDNSLRFHEICDFLETRGFRTIDLIAPRHRHLDNALWQMDLVFIRADRDEFQSNSFY